MLTYMTSQPDTVAGHDVASAHLRNATLAGQELTSAAATVTLLARRYRAAVLAADGAGDRIIGAALATAPTGLTAANTTARLDGQTILVVSGAMAGPVTLLQVAARLRSLGACAVHAAVLDGWPQPLVGYDTVEALATDATVAAGRPTARRRRVTNAA
jgi:hypothetical protein